MFVPLKGDVLSTHGITIDLRDIEINKKIRGEIACDTYEAGEAKAIQKYVNYNSDVIELGACLGFISCLTNKILDKESTHIVVEPNPSLIPVLEQNRDINECDFEVYESAYNYNNPRINLTIPDNIWGTSSHRDDGSSVTVDTINLETLVTDHNLSEFVLIVDIEGAEINLIENEIDLLEEYCELLIIEFHDEKETYEHLVESTNKARESLIESEFDMIEEISTGVEVYKNNGISD
jgi:FkbM family methyltransferase